MTLDVETEQLRARMIRSAENLTPLPSAVTRLAQLIHDPESSPDDISAAVQHDPVLTASVLREANSSWVAARSDITTVDRAFILLGRARLLMLAVKGHVTEHFQPALPQYGMAKGELWQHSVVSATAASVVRDASGTDPGGEALTAALLHDLSKMVLCDYLDSDALCDRPRHASTTDIERHLLRIDHAELGGIITRRWGLPDSICDAIECHHAPDTAPSPLAAHAVAVSDALAHDVLENLDADLEISEHRIDSVAASLEALRIKPSSWSGMARRTLELVVSAG